MKIISTNISKPKTVQWKTIKVTTGIFKEPTNLPIYLGKEDVKNDHVIDRVAHGGVDKACYLFSVNYYGYWKKKYPDLDWQYGMFGENLTISEMNEDSVYIGDVYKIGDAVMEVCQPRQPCFKLGIKFKDQLILRQFIEHNHPGFYVRVLQQGSVKLGDSLVLEKRLKKTVSISQVFKFLYQKEKDKNLLNNILALNIPFSLKKHLQKIVTG